MKHLLPFDPTAIDITDKFNQEINTKTGKFPLKDIVESAKMIPIDNSEYWDYSFSKPKDQLYYLQIKIKGSPVVDIKPLLYYKSDRSYPGFKLALNYSSFDYSNPEYNIKPSDKAMNDLCISLSHFGKVTKSMVNNNLQMSSIYWIAQKIATQAINKYKDSLKETQSISYKDWERTNKWGKIKDLGYYPDYYNANKDGLNVKIMHPEEGSPYQITDNGYLRKLGRNGYFFKIENIQSLDDMNKLVDRLYETILRDHSSNNKAIAIEIEKILNGGSLKESLDKKIIGNWKYALEIIKYIPHIIKEDSQTGILSNPQIERLTNIWEGEKQLKEYIKKEDIFNKYNGELQIFDKNSLKIYKLAAAGKSLKEILRLMPVPQNWPKLIEFLKRFDHINKEVMDTDIQQDPAINKLTKAYNLLTTRK